MSTPTITPTQVLTPVAILALTLFVSIGFQTVQIMRDHKTLSDAITQQQKPLEESRKVQAQLSALALGTKKLADGGDKNAATIIARMEQAGINIGSQQPGQQGRPAAGGPGAVPAMAPPAQP